MVAGMAHTPSLLNAKSEFDRFLFAPIGEDKRGTMVSVLTAFARLDFDPWQQAADFVRLPKEAAKTCNDREAPGYVVVGNRTQQRSRTPYPPLAGASRCRHRRRHLGHTAGCQPARQLSIAQIHPFGCGHHGAGIWLPASNDAPAALNRQSADTNILCHPPASADPSQGDAASTSGSTIGDMVSNGKKPRDLIDLRGKDGKAALAQPAQQTQTSASARPVPTTTPARGPLFGR